MNKISALAALALVAAVAPLTSCSTKGCTAIGCSSDATVTVVGAVAAWGPMLPMNLKACIDDCRQFRIDRDAAGTICIPPPSADLSWQCIVYAGNVTLIAPVSGAGS